MIKRRKIVICEEKNNKTVELNRENLIKTRYSGIVKKDI